MSYQFRIKDIEECYISSDKKSSRLLLPKNLGYIDSSKEDISEDIYLMKNEIYTKEDLKMFTESKSKDWLIKITLTGDIKYNDHILKKDKPLSSNNLSISYIKESKGAFDIPKESLTKGLAIGIKESYLKRNLLRNLGDRKRKEIEKNYNENIPIILKSSLANPRTIFLANEIYHSPFNGTLQDIYLQSKAYEIIYNEFLNLITPVDKIQKSNKMKLDKNDIEALHRAKDIILKDKTSISLSELAKKVALNENKLKYGFKKIFKTTPGSIILEAKMYEAKKLLETSELNITEISEQIGYKYVQSFTVAFTRFFGINPKELMKNRKYYY